MSTETGPGATNNAHSRPNSSTSNRKIKTVVIPVAGLGSRFLPATKVLPKELLPIVDRPIIHFIVEEAVRAGIKNVVFVTSRPKVLIEDYFDPADLTTFKLRDLGKDSLVAETLALSAKINIISVRQYEPLGLGHAILQAAPVVGDDPFAVLLGDDIVLSKNSDSALKECIELFGQKESGSVVGVLEIDPTETHKYGIVAFKEDSTSDDQGSDRIDTFVEKPDPSHAPSNWALPGRYVFENGIINALRETSPGKGGEIQLTDAMVRLVQSSPFYAAKLYGERFDTGSKLGYIMANVSYVLDDPAEGPAFKKWLLSKI